MTDGNYKYDISEDNKTAVIKLNPNVLGGNDALNFQQLVTDLTGKEVETVKIDMNDVNVINSSGLGMLISAYSQLKKAGKTMQLENVPSKVKKLLEITKFDRIFDL